MDIKRATPSNQDVTITNTPLDVTLGGIVDSDNSSSTPLLAGAEFIGAGVDTLDYALIFVTVYSEVGSATDGLHVDVSSDGITWRQGDTFTIPAGVEKTFSFQPNKKFYRTHYINGALDQTTFDLHTVLKKGNSKPSSHRVDDSLSGQDDAELVKAVVSGKDENGIYRNQRVSEVGVALTSDFLLEVSKGNIEGHSHVNKFGHNPLATAGHDIWHGGGVYNFFPTTAQSMEIVSTDATDAAAGTGAIQVIIYGLDANWDEINETVTMNGLTPVALVNTYIRMFRAFVLEAGTDNVNNGDISVQITGGGTVGAFIAADDGQTQMAIYTIPAGKTAYFLKGYVGLSNDDKNGEDGTFVWQSKANNGLNGAWLIKGQMGLVNIGNSHWQYEYGVPAGPIPEKTDIKIRLQDSSDTMNCVGGFDLLLVDD